MQFRLRVAQLLLWVIGFGFIVHLVQSDIININSAEHNWSHKLDLEQESGIKFRWRNTQPDKDGQRWIIIEATAKARGYVGVGFSPHGGMAGADMAISWMDSDGVAHIRDFHGIENGPPIEDVKQDYHLLNFHSEGDKTTVMFKRRWDTCDDQDFLLSTDTQRLIWAYSDSKPGFMNGKFMAQYHGPVSRGVKSVIIAEGNIIAPFPDSAPELYPGVKTFDFTMDRAPVNVKDTSYYCKLFKFTDLRKKHHMIGWKPIFEPGKQDLLHHMILFECSVSKEEVPAFDKFYREHPGGACYTPNMPAEWGRNCVAFSFVWVVGSEGEMLPEELGEEHGGATYFMMEMHYENPAHRITTDSSGVRLFYTDKLRQYDGATMLIGYRHSPFLLIPPHQENFVVNGVCGTECTSKVIPPTGLHLISSAVHMHLTGKKIRLRHFRNGVEQPIIAEDNHYDFNYQQGRALKDELIILPGDELLAECEYSTTNKDRYVIGGLSTHQEMCQVFFFYYPRVPLSQCSSQYEFHSFFQGFGIEDVEGKVLKPLNMPYEPHLLPIEEQEKDLGDDAKELEALAEGTSFKSVFDLMNISQPNSLRGKSVGSWLEEMKWTNARGKQLEEFWRNGKQYQFCSKPGLKRVILDNHIVEYPKIKGPSEICLREQSSGGSIVGPIPTLPFVFVSMILLRNI